jgi:quinol monooxygenase YgiN/dTDP-4-dehydrorhamnose 3,5-epimerase-like enzyme
VIHVLATIHLAPGARERFLEEFAQLVPLVRAEEGCIEYGAAVEEQTAIAAQAPVRADEVTVIEKWASEAALAAHLDAPHMHTHRERVRGLTTGTTIRILRPAEEPRVGGVAHVETIAVHGDARGVVVEPATPELLPAQRNAHVVTTAPGAVRGNHYHERGTETALVLGPALVRVRESTGVRDIHVPAGEAYRFTFPPRVSHAFQNTGAAPMVLVAFNTSAFDRGAPDVVPDVLITVAGRPQA